MANLPTANNNPGDLRDIGQTDATQGAGGFASFPNPQAGTAALLNDIQTKMNNHPNWTLSDFANVYAPPSDNNDTAQYTANLANQLGVAPNANIGSLEPRIGDFASAISKNEGYQGNMATSPIAPSADAAGSAPSSSSSGGSWINKLLLGGGVLGGIGLIAANLLAPEVTVPVEAGAAAAAEGGATLAGTAAATAAGSGIMAGASNLFSKAAPYLSGAAASDVVNRVGNAVTGSNQPQSSSIPYQQNQQPQFQAPQGNESVTPPFQPQPQQPTTPQQLEQQLPQANEASQRAYQAQNQMMQNLPSGRVMMQQDDYRNGAGANSRYGNIGTSDENGAYDASGTEEKKNNLVGQINEGQKATLQAEGASGQIDEGIQAAKANNEKYVAEPEQEEANNHANNIINSYASKHADKNGRMPLHIWHKIMTEQGKAFDKNASNAKNAAAKSVSAAARKVIKDNTYHKEFFERTQKEKKDIINGQKINEFLNGKKIPKNKSFMRDLLKSTGGAAGIYLGDKIGGPLGAILGNMVGEKISRAADKRHGRNVFETKGMKAAMEKVQQENPAVGKVLQQEIQKAHQEKLQRDMQQQSVPKLAAPQGIPMGARTGENKAVVVGGKRPPKNFEEATKRKTGKPEFGGLYEYYQHLKQMQNSK